jgi:hypothetical protein
MTTRPVLVLTGGTDQPTVGVSIVVERSKTKGPLLIL